LTLAAASPGGARSCARSKRLCGESPTSAERLLLCGFFVFRHETVWPHGHTEPTILGSVSTAIRHTLGPRRRAHTARAHSSAWLHVVEQNFRTSEGESNLNRYTVRRTLSYARSRRGRGATAHVGRDRAASPAGPHGGARWLASGLDSPAPDRSELRRHRVVIDATDGSASRTHRGAPVLSVRRSDRQWW